MKKQRYLIPPPMTKKTMHGGFRFRDLAIAVGAIVIICFIMSQTANLKLFYAMAIPVAYVILTYTPPGQLTNGLSIFAVAWNFCRTPQRYTLPRRKDFPIKDGERHENI